jgi:peptidoglycan/LPS O-acetylase OafA/YrhL
MTETALPLRVPGRFIAPADLRHDGNIFNVLRIIFASAVIFSHAYVLTGNEDPSLDVLPFSISRLAVLLFFSLSGFLVTNSLMTRGVRQYAFARGLRMLPGLWVMLVITALASILLFNRQPAGETATSASFWQYLAYNGALIGRHYTIAGSYPDNPVAGVINGSLWTIPREVQCYIALALIGAAGLLGRRGWLLAAFAIGTIVHLALPHDLVPALTDLRPLALSFFAGVLLFLFRERVFLSWPLAIAAILLTMVATAGPFRELAAQFTAAYVTLVLAILVPAQWKRLSSAMPDYSFGMYIYAFVVQQALIASGIAATPISNMVATLAFTLPLAALSWHFVEKPALALKTRKPKPAGAETRPASGA